MFGAMVKENRMQASERLRTWQIPEEREIRKELKNISYKEN